MYERFLLKHFMLRSSNAFLMVHPGLLVPSRF